MAHRSERTTKLHTAFNTLTIEEALKVATDLGYTVSGAKSWFSWWRKHEAAPKVDASAKKAKSEKVSDPAPVVDKDAAKREARNKKRREARAAAKRAAEAAKEVEVA